MPITDTQGRLIGPKNTGDINYEFDYYSGSQINIFLGDIIIDSAIAIQVSVSQSKTPIFGYASQYYSFVADGHVLVQGSLLVGFKEAGYLFYPIKRSINNSANVLNSINPDDYSFSKSPRYSVDQDGNIINSYEPKTYSLTEASKAAKNKKVMEANVEQMFDWDYQGGPNGQPKLRKKYNKFYRELEALDDDAFEDWAETFEDAVWYGSDKSNPFVRDKMFSKNIPTGVTIDNEDVLRHRRADQYPEVDILITYGDMSKQPSNHTVKKLLDVSFVGQSQSIEISGQPIFEKYDFICKNFV
jgi:hypothetical protein